MKTTLFVLIAGLMVGALQAQDETYSDPALAEAVVYQAPVIYQVPVIYQAAVVYQAGVSFQGPVQYEPPPPAAACVSTPNVVYVAGPGNCGPNYYRSGYCSPNVIYFGRGESYLRGYHFTRGR